LIWRVIVPDDTGLKLLGASIIAPGAQLRHIELMSKPATSRTQRVDKRSGYVVLGTTSDGVRILKPAVRATHFTPAQLKRAVKQIREAIANDAQRKVPAE
jgi:hypothetical protein